MVFSSSAPATLFWPSLRVILFCMASRKSAQKALKLKKFEIVALAVSIIIAPSLVWGQTIADLQAQIQVLLQQLAVLQAQPTTPPQPGQPDDYGLGTSPETFCPTLSVTMRRGARDATTGGQVTELQLFLADRYGLNEEDIVTGYFGKLTQSYVIKFQQETGLPSYGIVGTLTRAKIAEVCGGPIPSATFSASPTSGPAPLDVGFSARGSGPYSIDFGDGQSASMQVTAGTIFPPEWRAMHTYTSTGTYAAKLYSNANPCGPTQNCIQVPLGTATITVTGAATSEDWVGGCANPPTVSMDATVGIPFRFNVGLYAGVTIAGAPYPSLPSGLTANGNFIEGTPTVAGSFSSKTFASNSCQALLMKITIRPAATTTVPLGTYRIYYSGYPDAKGETKNISEAYALENCRLNVKNANDDPRVAKVIRCMWNDKVIFATQPTCRLTFSKSQVKVNEPFTVTWASENADYVSDSNGKNGANGSKQISAQSAGTFTYTMTAYGFGGQSQCSEMAAVASAPAVSISTDKPVYAPGGTVTITWDNPNATTAKDWITAVPTGLKYVPEGKTPGAGETKWPGIASLFFYTGGAKSGTKTLTAPSTPGVHDVVYYANDGYTEVARSQGAFTISSSMSADANANLANVLTALESILRSIISKLSSP